MAEGTVNASYVEAQKAVLDALIEAATTAKTPDRIAALGSAYSDLVTAGAPRKGGNGWA